MNMPLWYGVQMFQSKSWLSVLMQFDSYVDKELEWMAKFSDKEAHWNECWAEYGG